MAIKKTDRIYEICFHIEPNLSEKEAETIFKDVENLIKKSGGESVDFETPKHMELMYPIRSQERAGNDPYERFNSSYFASLKFSLPVDGVNEVKTEVDKNKSIFRSILFETTKESHRVAMPEMEGETADKEQVV